MKKLINFWPLGILLLVIFIVFNKWFMPGLISAGDLWPFHRSMYDVRPLSLYAWDYLQGAGMGGYSGALLWIYLNFGIAITILGKFLGFNWEIIERVYFMYPFLLVGSISPFLLSKKILGKSRFLYFAPAIFIFNTYSLMLVGGGQFGVALSIALTPLVLLGFLKTADSKAINYRNLAYGVFTGLILSVQIIFDLRIAYVTIAAVMIYWLLKVALEKDFRSLLISFLFTFPIPGLLALLVNFFWILPTIINRQNPLTQFGTAYTSLGAVKFFSFASFENATGLLHPNWPENIFGKIGFMKPEFMLLPILAFTALFFIRTINGRKHKIYILYFTLLALTGVFLAKGANEPFGGAYLWMFEHVPGFMMFRDPTKWYILIVVSYSVLIPFTIEQIYKRINVLKSFYGIIISKIFVLTVISGLLFLLKPALIGQLGGAFKPTVIPADYQMLTKFLESQNSFSRTLWVPTVQRFAFYDSRHPAIPAQDLFGLYDSRQIFSLLKTKQSEQLLQGLAVKYIVIPYDSQGEIFLNDRKYDNKAYLRLVQELKTISWLKQINGFGAVTVFEVPDAKDHFWTASKNLILNYQYLSPVEYRLMVSNAQKGDVLVFAENFDKNWQARNSSVTLDSIKFENRLNSFVLPKDGTNTLDVYFSLQKYVEAGELISVITLLSAFGYLFFAVIKFKNI